MEVQGAYDVLTFAMAFVTPLRHPPVRGVLLDDAIGALMHHRRPGIMKGLYAELGHPCIVTCCYGK